MGSLQFDTELPPLADILRTITATLQVLRPKRFLLFR
jgi:hypothetical protein